MPVYEVAVLFGAERSLVTQIKSESRNEWTEQSKNRKQSKCLGHVGWKNLVEEFYIRAPPETWKIEGAYRNNRRKKHDWSIVWLFGTVRGKRKYQKDVQTQTDWYPNKLTVRGRNNWGLVWKYFSYGGMVLCFPVSLSLLLSPDLAVLKNVSLSGFHFCLQLRVTEECETVR